MLSAEALSFRQQSRLAISLSWIGGFTNVIAFLTWRIFASHVTGASTMLGLSSASLNPSELLLYATLVSSFLAGAIASALMTELLTRRGAPSKYVMPLTVEALLLTLLLIALTSLRTPDAPLPTALLLSLTAFTMGLQNATITRISGAVVRSTHLTGVVTDIGIESVRFALWAWDQSRGRPWIRAGRVLRVSQRHPHLLRLALLCSIWASFLFGTIAGTLAFRPFHHYCLLGPIAFLLFIILRDIRKPTASIREIDPLADPDLHLHGILHSLLPPSVGLYRLHHDRHRHFRAPSFNHWIDRLPSHKRIILLTLTPALTFDDAALLDLERALAKLEAAHRTLLLANVTPAHYKRLAHHRLIPRLRPENIHPDLEFALARALDLARA